MNKKPDNDKIVIKHEDLSISIGHQPHSTGSGAHEDKRTKRQRTRAAKAKQAIEEDQ